MTKHFKQIVEDEPQETSWGDYVAGALDQDGFCRNPNCRQPGNRRYGFCLFCEEL